MGKQADSLRSFALASNLAHEIGDKTKKAASLREHGAALYFAGKYRELAEVLKEALQLAEELGDRSSYAKIAGAVGDTLSDS